MEPTRELIDDLYRSKVLLARATPPLEKLLDGPRLFDAVCARMRDGIRYQFPDADEERVEAILRERLDIIRRLEQVR